MGLLKVRGCILEIKVTTKIITNLLFSSQLIVLIACDQEIERSKLRDPAAAEAKARYEATEISETFFSSREILTTEKQDLINGVLYTTQNMDSIFDSRTTIQVQNQLIEKITTLTQKNSGTPGTQETTIQNDLFIDIASPNANKVISVTFKDSGTAITQYTFNTATRRITFNIPIPELSVITVNYLDNAQDLDNTFDLAPTVYPGSVSEVYLDTDDNGSFTNGEALNPNEYTLNYADKKITFDQAPPSEITIFIEWGEEDPNNTQLDAFSILADPNLAATTNIPGNIGITVREVNSDIDNVTADFVYDQVTKIVTFNNKPSPGATITFNYDVLEGVRRIYEDLTLPLEAKLLKVIDTNTKKEIKANLRKNDVGPNYTLDLLDSTELYTNQELGITYKTPSEYNMIYPLLHPPLADPIPSITVYDANDNLRNDCPQEIKDQQLLLNCSLDDVANMSISYYYLKPNTNFTVRDVIFPEDGSWSVDIDNQATTDFTVERNKIKLNTPPPVGVEVIITWTPFPKPGQAPAPEAVNETDPLAESNPEPPPENSTE